MRTRSSSLEDESIVAFLQNVLEKLSQVHVVAGVKVYVPNSLIFGVVWSFCIWFVKAFNYNKGKRDLRSELTARLQYVSFPGVTGNSSH